MNFISLFLATIFFVPGYLITFHNKTWLIAGYNDLDQSRIPTKNKRIVRFLFGGAWFLTGASFILEILLVEFAVIEPSFFPYSIITAAFFVPFSILAVHISIGNSFVKRS